MLPLLRSFRHRSFALLWSGQTVSRLGDSLYRIALAWWVLTKTGSAVAMGTVAICSFLPTVLFALLGGVAVDRYRRVHVMLASDVLRAVVVGVVAVLAFTQRLQLWHVYAASALFGTVGAFFSPAYSAIVPELLTEEVLPSANALTRLSNQAAGVIGPAVGAAVVAAGGTPLAFVLDAAAFLVSAACLLPLVPQTTSHAAGRKGSALRELQEGLRTVLASPWVWMTIAIASVANITLGGPFAVALPLLVKQRFGEQVGALGLLYAMLALGAGSASVWLGRLPRLRRRGLVAYSAWSLTGLLLAVVGLPVPLAVAAVAVLVVGAANCTFGLIWTNTLQELVPRELLGRVSSVDSLGSYALIPVGYAVTGWAADQFGASVVFIVGGALTAGLVLLGLTHPAIRAVD